MVQKQTNPQKPTLSQEMPPFAEIIESKLDSFLAQCWEWNFFPSFGSLVQVETKNHLVLGMVTNMQTGSMDPMRYPFPYQKTEEELKAEQPQIFEFLKTTFRAQIVGYLEKGPKGNLFEGNLFYLLPPKPCKIHAFVAQSPTKVSSWFFEKPEFLHLLFAFESNIPSLDELLLATLRSLAHQGVLDTEKLEKFCQSFSLLTGNDYRRLKLFLKRAQSIL